MDVVIEHAAGKRFLDVGSGLGTKLHLARILGFDAHGLELRGHYADASRELFSDCPVTVGDASAFSDYDAFDVVYCYRPCVDPDEQTRLNRLISERMATGALFFSAGGPWPDWLDHVGGQVWRKP